MLTLHCHSGEFCAHASGTLAETVAAAAAQGFRVLGLSEHVPRTADADLYPEERAASLTVDDLARRFDAYVAAARRHQHALPSGDASAAAPPAMLILVGCETELIRPSDLALARALAERHRLDYLVGSVHHVYGVPIDFDAAGLDQAEACAEQRRRTLAASAGRSDVDDLSDAAADATEQLFMDYFDAQQTMLETLRPTVVAHFDLIRLFRPAAPLTPRVWRRVRRNAAWIAAHDMLVEINSRALKKGLADPYPMGDVARVLRDAGCRFTLADDSHGADQIGLGYDAAWAYVRRLGLTRLWYPLPRRDGGSDPAVLPRCPSRIPAHRV
ncbi:hypothetical protein CXG81DRAFT_29197 [Caulochytrium protostelioides]|uniref:Histidinol-phosphatase n=1 Tax=Caulochytrium protostelioides TaxID=1555241 RepID=A0A4P9XDU0_9FUNG|nr:hypothetical protein CXG81DRAFT_29197 [Caulochytrium protostelioides]|eukprot:RKP03697.1 hypothetical protein CXG81DRAFT_29197 [Caulochytrium protostelioides]